MFCPKCGSKLRDGAKFCTVCGNPVPQQSSTAPQQQAAQPEPPKATAQQAAPAYQPQPAPQPAPAPAPQPQAYYQPQQAAPAYQPQPAPQPAIQPEKTAPEKPVKTRDGRGKYIVKRLIFCAIAILVGILSAILFQNAFPEMRRASSLPENEFLRRSLLTLAWTLIPLVFAFVIAMLTGLVKRNGGKNVFRVISVVLRSLTPVALVLLLIDFLGLKLKLLPISAMAGGLAWILPLLTLTLPLTGYLMNASVTNGHKTTFGGSVGAAAAWAADHMPAIVASVVLIEAVVSARGIGNVLYQGFMTMNLKVIFFALIIFVVIVYILKLLMDVIASLASGGDPAEQVYARRSKEDRSGNVLFVIGLILAALALTLAIIGPIFVSSNPFKVDVASRLLRPGTNGHLLGTDETGRDLLSMILYGLRTTAVAGLTNTLIALLPGIGFGVLAGVIRGGAREIFKGLRYVLGFGAPFALFLIFLIGKGAFPGAMFFVIGLFSWGGIAERIGYGIKAKRAARPEKTALILPVLEQVVHTFCAAVIWVNALSFLGLTSNSVKYITLGRILATGRQMIAAADYVVLWPALALILLLGAFYLLHAGLCAKERFLQKEAKQ